MYTDAKELIKFRNELIQGGFDEEQAYGIVSGYYDAKLENYNDNGIVFLAEEQDGASASHPVTISTDANEDETRQAIVKLRMPKFKP